jgi:hypothetical protein
MEVIIAAVQDYGLTTVLAGVLIYVLLRGEVSFRYPAKKR